MADLNILVNEYYNHKQKLDEIDKICKAENADIKKEMESQNITEFDTADLHAKYIVQKRESMNEDKLIMVLKERGFENFIRTKEYVDMDDLENALYHNDIDTDTIMEMDKCKEVKEVIQLKVTKKKGGKE